MSRNVLGDSVWVAKREPTHAYYARWKDCDCIVAVCVDVPGFEDLTAKDVADYVRKGYRPERLSLADAEGRPWRCEAHPKGTPPPWRTAPEFGQVAR